MAEDQFNLEERAEGHGPAAPRPRREWTAAEIEEKVKGYIEVDPEFWETIRYGTHVRYYTRNGDFHPGGFVLKNPFDTKPKGGAVEKRFITLQSDFNSKARGHFQWIVAYEDLQRVYVKQDAAGHVIMKSLKDAVTGLNANIKKLHAHAQALEKRVAALESRR